MKAALNAEPNNAAFAVKGTGAAPCFTDKTLPYQSSNVTLDHDIGIYQ